VETEAGSEVRWGDGHKLGGSDVSRDMRLPQFSTPFYQARGLLDQTGSGRKQFIDFSAQLLSCWFGLCHCFHHGTRR
jgi:hypothetical protein